MSLHLQPVQVDTGCSDEAGELVFSDGRLVAGLVRQPLKLKAWALDIARRSTMRKARIALARRLAIIMHAMVRQGTEFKPA